MSTSSTNIHERCNVATAVAISIAGTKIYADGDLDSITTICQRKGVRKYCLHHLVQSVKSLNPYINGSEANNFATLSAGINICSANGDRD